MDIEHRVNLWRRGYWEVPDGLDVSNFDFSWRPKPVDRPYIHQFGTQWQKTGGPRFIVPENEGVKYQNHQYAIKLPDPNNRSWRPLKHNATIDYSWHPDETEPPFIYVFGNQWYDAEVMATIQYKVKGATVKKYVQDVKATLTPDLENWITPDDIDETQFDYSWLPHPYDPPLIYQFGTQWQKTGGPAYVTPGANTIKYMEELKSVRKPNMRGWRILETIDADKFDFSWHPDDTEDPYTYTFGNQWHTAKDMPTVVYRARGASLTKPCSDQVAKITDLDKVEYSDSIFDSVMKYTYDKRYVHFRPKESNAVINYDEIIPKSETFYIHILNNTEAIVPKECVDYMYDKLMDYPHVIHHNVGHVPEPLDIVFFSNGEKIADENFEHLRKITEKLPNRLVRVDGVNGRVASQHAAANASNTAWYFLVNAKLRVNEDFDFSWQPNRLQTRKHYIFRATNPVNGLEYGHMAIVANNKLLTLNTVVKGLDFTMDSPVEIVNINCGVAMYNTSEWDTWRTAFREVIKLCNANDDESKQRLDAWLNNGIGDFADMSIKGAKDAVDYYDSVNGEMDKLMLSYDWKWLRERFDAK